MRLPSRRLLRFAVLLVGVAAVGGWVWMKWDRGLEPRWVNPAWADIEERAPAAFAFSGTRAVVLGNVVDKRAPEKGSAVVAFALRDGHELWRCTPHALPERGDKVECIVADEAGDVYAALNGGQVIKLAGATGREIWHYDLPQMNDDLFSRIVRLQLAAPDALQVSFGALLLRIARESGRVLWENRLEPYATGDIGRWTVGPAGDVFVHHSSSTATASGKQELTRLASADGAQLWAVPDAAPDGAFGRMELCASGTGEIIGLALASYVTDGAPEFLCWDAARGHLLWRKRMDPNQPTLTRTQWGFWAGPSDRLATLQFQRTSFDHFNWRQFCRAPLHPGLAFSSEDLRSLKRVSYALSDGSEVEAALLERTETSAQGPSIDWMGGFETVGGDLSWQELIWSGTQLTVGPVKIYDAPSHTTHLLRHTERPGSELLDLELYRTCRVADGSWFHIRRCRLGSDRRSELLFGVWESR